MSKGATASGGQRPTRKKGLRTFLLYLDNQTTREVEAVTLLRALAESGIKETKTQILAAVDQRCLATPRDESIPALIAIIRNPAFTGKLDE